MKNGDHYKVICLLNNFNWAQEYRKNARLKSCSHGQIWHARSRVWTPPTTKFFLPFFIQNLCYAAPRCFSEINFPCVKPKHALSECVFPSVTPPVRVSFTIQPSFFSACIFYSLFQFLDRGKKLSSWSGVDSCTGKASTSLRPFCQGEKTVSIGWCSMCVRFTSRVFFIRKTALTLKLLSIFRFSFNATLHLMVLGLHILLGNSKGQFHESKVKS